MELQELLAALHQELEEAGIPSKGTSASLAFVAKKNREGGIDLDFVDAATMSKPRPEDLHRLEVTLADRNKPKAASKTEQGEGEGESPFRTTEEPASKSKFKKSGVPPALPPKRS